MKSATRTGAWAIAVVLAAATGAQAQLPHPDCAKLPNGGTLRVDVPGLIGPTTCQACAPGFNIPANFFLGFSNDHHDTCELKRPDGTNSGYCKADSRCPPGTNRIYQNNTVWVCQAQGTTTSISCPALPKVEVPSGPGTRKAPEPPPACSAELAKWEGRLKQREAELRASVTNDATTRGTAAANAAKDLGIGVGAYGAAVAILMAELNPIGIRVAIVCSDYGTGNAQGDQACENTRKEYYDKQERSVTPVYNRSLRALASAGDSLRTLGRGGDDPAGTAVTAAQQDLDEARRQLTACMTQIQRWSIEQLKPRFK